MIHRQAALGLPLVHHLVQEGVLDEVIAKLRIRMGSLRVGDPLDKNTDVGAINSKQQLEKITELSSPIACGRG